MLKNQRSNRLQDEQVDVEFEFEDDFNIDEFERDPSWRNLLESATTLYLANDR